MEQAIGYLIFILMFFGGIAVALLLLRAASSTRRARISRTILIVLAFLVLLFQGGCVVLIGALGRATGGGSLPNSMRWTVAMIPLAFIVVVVWTLRICSQPRQSVPKVTPNASAALPTGVKHEDSKEMVATPAVQAQPDFNVPTHVTSSPTVTPPPELAVSTSAPDPESGHTSLPDKAQPAVLATAGPRTEASTAGPGGVPVAATGETASDQSAPANQPTMARRKRPVFGCLSFAALPIGFLVATFWSDAAGSSNDWGMGGAIVFLAVGACASPVGIITGIIAWRRRERWWALWAIGLLLSAGLAMLLLLILVGLR